MELSRCQIEDQIWDFLSRVAVILAADYKDDKRVINVDDLHMVKHKIIHVKMGLQKEITYKEKLPFRTRFFFNKYYTNNNREAYNFFNPMNKGKGKEWLISEVLMPLNRFNLLDWCGSGNIAHIDAIDNNYSTQSSESKRTY